jgi:hypothetical protein
MQDSGFALLICWTRGCFVYLKKGILFSRSLEIIALSAVFCQPALAWYAFMLCLYCVTGKGSSCKNPVIPGC